MAMKKAKKVVKKAKKTAKKASAKKYSIPRPPVKPTKPGRK